MKISAALTLVLCLAQPAFSGVEEALDDHILPSFQAFAEDSEELARAAAADCGSEAMAPAFHAAFDSWMQVADLRLGPSETGALSVAFWPDTRGFTQRALSRLIADEDPVVFDAEAFEEVSIAARGFLALEMLQFDPAFSEYDDGSYSCALVQAISRDLARQADTLARAWRNDFAVTLRTAGEAGNAIYLDESEAMRALYTQLLAGLEFSADQRLGRPLGTFEQPRPTRAEAWRSDRSLRNVLLSVEAATALAHTLSDGDLPETDAAVARVRDVAGRVTDPGFQDISEPPARLRVEVVQQAVKQMRAALEIEMGTAMGIAPGFNSQDGD